MWDISEIRTDIETATTSLHVRAIEYVITHKGQTSTNAYLKLAIVVATGIVAVAHAEVGPLTVCEALSSIRDREDVTIHAPLLLTRHLTAVAEAFDNSDPCPGWPRRFFTAPSVIPLTGPLFGVRVSVEVWRKALDFFGCQRMRQRENPSYHPMMTVRGVLLRKTWPLIFRGHDGEYFGWGFGLDGASAALLVLTSPPTLDLNPAEAPNNGLPLR
jgi:hypothetical protein